MPTYKAKCKNVKGGKVESSVYSYTTVLELLPTSSPGSSRFAAILEISDKETCRRL